MMHWLWMEQSELGNVGVMFDTAHAFHRCEPPTDYIYTMGANLKHVHLTDYNRTAPGTAGCDFVAIMQALDDVDYKGYVTLEKWGLLPALHIQIQLREYLWKI